MERWKVLANQVLSQKSRSTLVRLEASMVLDSAPAAGDPPQQPPLPPDAVAASLSPRRRRSRNSIGGGGGGGTVPGGGTCDEQPVDEVMRRLHHRLHDAGNGGGDANLSPRAKASLRAKQQQADADLLRLCCGVIGEMQRCLGEAGVLGRELAESLVETKEENASLWQRLEQRGEAAPQEAGRGAEEEGGLFASRDQLRAAEHLNHTLHLQNKSLSQTNAELQEEAEELEAALAEATRGAACLTERLDHATRARARLAAEHAASERSLDALRDAAAAADAAARADASALRAEAERCRAAQREAEALRAEASLREAAAGEAAHRMQAEVCRAETERDCRRHGEARAKERAAGAEADLAAAERRCQMLQREVDEATAAVAAAAAAEKVVVPCAPDKEEKVQKVTSDAVVEGARVCAVGDAVAAVTPVEANVVSFLAGIRHAKAIRKQAVKAALRRGGGRQAAPATVGDGAGGFGYFFSRR